MTTPSDPNDPGYQQPNMPNYNYPSAPPPSDYGTGRQQPASAPPTELTASFWLYLVAAIIVLLSGLLALGAKTTVLNTLRASNTTLTEAQLESAANVLIAITVVLVVIIAGLYVLFAFKLRAGRNWARIVLTIIAVLNLAALVGGRAGSAIGYIGELAAVVGCVLSYLPTSSAYIAAVKQSRYVR